jgi:outer membrane receptor protein involved in Fe transport
LDGFPAGTRANAQAEATAARLDFRSAVSSSLTVDAGLGNQALTSGVPGGLGFLTPQATQGNAQSDGHVTLTRHGQNSALSLSFSGARAALSYNDPQNGGESDTYDSRTQVSLREVVGSERNSLVTGIDLSRESALLFLGAASVPPTATAALSQSAAYAQYRAALANTAIFTVGLRGEHDSPQGSVLVPAAGVSFGAGAARLSLNYAQTFRAPTIDDLYFPGFSNPNLVPERSQNFDATLKLPLGFASASLGWFERQAVNLIALDQNFVPRNIARASLAGFVFNARTAPFHGFAVTAGITDVYRALNLTPGQPATRLDFQPVTTTVLGIERPFGPGRTAFGVNANVQSPHNEGGVARGGQTTVDAYVRERLSRDLVMSVRARNLGDERYAPIMGYPAPGRTIEVELATK